MENTEYYKTGKTDQNAEQNEKHPSFKVWYSDDGENGVLWSLEKWDENLECEECQKIGSYFMVNEKYKIGSCLEHILPNIQEDKTTLWYRREFTNDESLKNINPVCIHGKNWSWINEKDACLICGKNGEYHTDPATLKL